MTGDARRLLVEKWRKSAVYDRDRQVNGGDSAWGHRAEIFTRCADELEAALSSEAEAPRHKDAGWQPIENPPKHKMSHSLPIIGWHTKGGVVLGHYTPFYIGKEDDMVWTAEKWSRRNGRITHWMPLPRPPATNGSGDEATDVAG